MQMPRVMRRINRTFTNRVMGPIAAYARPMAVVHHVGRKSGRSYRTPVLAFPLDGGYLTPLPYGTDTDWALNLLAAGGGELEVLGKHERVANPRIIDGDEAEQRVSSTARSVIHALHLPGFLLLDRAA